MVVANFGPDAVELPAGKILVTSQHGLMDAGLLEQDQVAWIKL